MKIIGLASSKGGVGKTTSAVQIASALALHGANVLIVDLDPQGAVCPTLSLPDPEPQHTVTAQLADPSDPVVQHCPDLPQLMVLGARPDVDTLGHTFEEGALRAFAAGLEHEPDFVILDLAPSMEPLTILAMAEADSLLVVVQASALAIRTIPALLDTVQHYCPATAIEGLLINHFGIAGDFGRQVAESLHASFGDWVFPVEIPYDEVLQRAAMTSQSVFLQDQRSTAAHAYQNVALELLERHRDATEPVLHTESRV